MPASHRQKRTSPQPDAPVPIGDVERQTGIRPATLRMWEVRYGFPRPLRDQNGDRVYPFVQVERLRAIRGLLDQGLRPSKIFASGADLATQPVDLAKEGADAPGLEPGNPALRLLREYRLGEFRSHLQHQLLKLGLRRFTVEVLGPLTHAVGAAWQSGHLPVRSEHVFTQQVTSLLHTALSNAVPVSRMPTVVLATLTGEMHALGILMAESVLVTHGAHCIQLGPETPASEVADTALEVNADIVVLSFSSYYPRRGCIQTLAEMRAALPASTEIWIGGQGIAHLRELPPGLHAIASLAAIDTAMSYWMRKAGT